jgi:hypothetical protein
MGRLKKSFIVLTAMVMAIVLSGCASTSPDPGKSLVVATVGAPTPIPTDVPEPTPGPTWVPTPTPIPPPVTLSDLSLTVKINGDQRPISGDPDQDLQLNAQYALRQDTAKFKVQNTGDATLNGLEITYQLVTPMSFVDSYSGQTSTTYRTQNIPYAIGTLKPGETRDIVLEAPSYGVMLEANLTITAKWDGGSLDLYRATLEPNLKAGSNISPANQQQVMMYGSAYN